MSNLILGQQSILCSQDENLVPNFLGCESAKVYKVEFPDFDV